MSRYLQRNWDTISLETVGFAQVGSDTYKAKAAVERQIITTFFTESEDLKVPEQFKDKAYFYWALCPHDFGSYYDFQIAYDRDAIDDMEEKGETLIEKFNMFWTWMNRCEAAMSIHEEYLYELCEKLYRKSITMEIVHQNVEKRNQQLKAV